MLLRAFLNDNNYLFYFDFMQLTQEQKDLLVGTLLGDGNLQTFTKGRTWRYRALQKEKDFHYEYLFHKYEILKDFCDTGPIFSKILDSRTGKTYERWYFNTTVQSSFRYYGNLFYQPDTGPNPNQRVKVVPKTIEQLLTPRAIAYWYMDDGSLKWKKKSNAMRICTESFSDDGVKRLQKALKKLYNIDTQLTRKTNNQKFVGYRLAINEQNSTAFRELIQPYLVDWMRYKVSDGNKGHL
jgi:hypothetical protein